MGLSSLFKKAKKTVEDRGGTDSLKQDAAELKDIATGEGSLSDKAKDAVEAVKEPGAADSEPGSGAAGAADTAATDAQK